MSGGRRRDDAGRRSAKTTARVGRQVRAERLGASPTAERTADSRPGRRGAGSWSGSVCCPCGEQPTGGSIGRRGSRARRLRQRGGGSPSEGRAAAARAPGRRGGGARGVRRRRDVRAGVGVASSTAEIRLPSPRPTHGPPRALVGPSWRAQAPRRGGRAACVSERPHRCGSGGTPTLRRGRQGGARRMARRLLGPAPSHGAERGLPPRPRTMGTDTDASWIIDEPRRARG